MNIDRSSIVRTVLLAAGCAALIVALVLLARQQLAQGFLFAFGGLSAISVSQTDMDYTAGFNARSFINHLATGRTHISALGRICDIASYLCLAGALISWAARR